MLGVALDGDGNGDFGGYGLDGNSDVGHSRSVGQRNRLVANRILVVATDSNVAQGYSACGTVRPGGRQLDAVQVQLLTKVIHGLVAAADRQLVADGVSRAAADLLAELVRVLTKRIVGTIVVCSPGTALYSGAVLGGSLRAEYDGAIHLCGVRIAGIQVLHEADASIRTAACGVGIGGDVVVPVQAVSVADDGTDILAAADLAGKAVGADGANHIIPGLGHEAVAAEDAADTLVALHGPVHGTGQDGGASTVGGRLVVVAAADDTTGVGTGGFYGAVEGRVADDALSHGVVSGADDAAHIASTLYGSRTGTVLDCTIDPSGKRTNLALIPFITNDDTGFNYTITDCYYKTSTSTGIAIATARCNQTRFQCLRATQQSDIFNCDCVSA